MRVGPDDAIRWARPRLIMLRPLKVRPRQTLTMLCARFGACKKAQVAGRFWGEGQLQGGKDFEYRTPCLRLRLACMFIWRYAETVFHFFLLPGDHRISQLPSQLCNLG